MYETKYQSLSKNILELEHHYGSNVHLLSDIVMQSDLAELSIEKTSTKRAHELVREIYKSLLKNVMIKEFPRVISNIETRMIMHNKEAIVSAELIDRKTSAVIVDVARAGMIPSQHCFEYLSEFLEYKNVRQDHIYINRKTNTLGEVIGINYSGSKIGGPIDNCLVLVPEPMGATGHSIAHTLDIYKNNIEGTAKKLIVMHLIVTPEYIAYLKKTHPDVIIYAVRLDRGLSDAATLKTPLGQNIEKEKGLNANQYIVPGLGGLGEILNNSYV